MPSINKTCHQKLSYGLWQANYTGQLRIAEVLGLISVYMPIYYLSKSFCSEQRPFIWFIRFGLSDAGYFWNRGSFEYKIRIKFYVVPDIKFYILRSV